MFRIAFLTLCALHAQESEVYKTGNGVSQPRLLSKVEPKYSDEARRAHIDAVVVLHLVVGADGAPRDLKVQRGAGFGLDEQAIKAVEQWRFQPGAKAGVPVAVYATIEVNFSIGQAAAFARLVFDLSGATRPELQHGSFKDLTAPAPATFHFIFEVNEHGDVENLQCAESGGEVAMRAIRKFKFQPAMTNGQPVRVPASLELSYK